MPTRYVKLKSNFDLKAFAGAMEREADENGVEFVAQFLGVSKATVMNWANENSAAYQEFPYPNMTNFLKFCNAFGYDPSHFFVTE